jgi:hypothetical protein
MVSKTFVTAGHPDWLPPWQVPEVRRSHALSVYCHTPHQLLEEMAASYLE